MAISYTQALNAYNQQSKLMENLGDAGEGDDAAASSSSGGGSSFEDMLVGTVKDAVASQHTAEQVQMQALSGKAELSDLVTAVTNAELALDTIVAVRDKAISAYQSIIGMPI